MRAYDSDISVTESESKTLVPTPVSLNSLIISLLKLTKIIPCLFLLPIDMFENLSVCHDDHYRCRTNCYKNLVACIVIRFVIVSVDFLLLISA